MNFNNLQSQVPLVIGLILYFAVHSLLASHRVKHWCYRQWPQLMPAYRLLYNLQSVILIMPLLWLVWWLPGQLLWQWTGIWAWLMNGLAILAVAGFGLTFKAYDGGRFLGFSQWREKSSNPTDTEPLSLSTLHRFVRHPWYCFSLVIIWTRDMYVSTLILFSVITIYLVVGSRLEENKLIAQYGDVYRHYRQRVPGLLPLPWRWLTRAEAAELLDEADVEKEVHRQQV